MGLHFGLTVFEFLVINVDSFNTVEICKFCDTAFPLPSQVYHPMEIPSMREPYNRAKVVIAKPGVYHRPPKSSTRVIGGHRYWQGKLSTPQHDVGRASRSPNRRIPPGGLKTSQSPTQRLSHTHSPSPRRNDTQMPLGIHISKLSSLRHLKERVPGVMGDKKVVYGRKES